MTLPGASSPQVLAALQALWHPATLPDPYPAYERLRALGPGGNVSVPEWGATFVTSHAANSAVLRSPLARSSTFAQEGLSDGQRLLSHMMLGMNGPDHRRVRGLVESAFTPRVVEEQRELVRSLLRELLGQLRDEGRAGGGGDVVSGLAHPLPARVVMTMLGLSGEDEQRFLRWSGSVAELIGGAQGSPELLARIDADAREMRAYFRDLADELRARPQPGLLSAMAAAQTEGGQLSGDELLSNAVLLLTAGHETTSNLIPGALLELARQPDAWAALCEAPEHPGVADELLRVVSPVQVDGRFLTADLTVDGHTLPGGQHVQLMLAAANRDPAVFPDPARIDWNRPNSSRHLAFAAGPHYCLGAALARLEIAEVFATLARDFPTLRVLDTKPPYKPNHVLRGVERLRVALEA